MGMINNKDMSNTQTAHLKKDNIIYALGSMERMKVRPEAIRNFLHKPYGRWGQEIERPIIEREEENVQETKVVIL